jgi:hypothetical protein
VTLAIFLLVPHRDKLDPSGRVAYLGRVGAGWGEVEGGFEPVPGTASSGLWDPCLFRAVSLVELRTGWGGRGTGPEGRDPRR